MDTGTIIGLCALSFALGGLVASGLSSFAVDHALEIATIDNELALVDARRRYIGSLNELSKVLHEVNERALNRKALRERIAQAMSHAA